MTLTTGDCLEEMARMPDESVHAEAGQTALEI